MKLRYIFIPLLLIVIAFVVWQFRQLPATEQAQTIAKLENILEHKVVFDKDNMAVRQSDRRVSENISQKKAELAGDTQTKLTAIAQQVDEISMFDNKSLEPFRHQVAALAAADPQGFRDFILQIASQAENSKTETNFFFVETFVQADSEPGQVVSQILNLKGDGKAEKDESSKTNLLKAFALENLFERHQQGAKFSEDPLPEVEVDLVRIAKNDRDLNLVREALLLLRDYYSYSKEQLKILVYARPEQDSYAFADILD